MANRYFTEDSLKFLKQLDKNNNREWFEQHKQEYEDRVRSPRSTLLPIWQIPSNRYRHIFSRSRKRSADR